MNKQIKKELYKQKPLAVFEKIEMGDVYYKTSIQLNGKVSLVRFKKPLKKIENATMNKLEPAHSLTRWLYMDGIIDSVEINKTAVEPELLNKTK